ncbi:MAG: DNA cytosine methyltransferase [Thermoproteota archaeon]
MSLFSGCGGLDEGFELTGLFKVIWANDIYEPSCRTFSKNFGLEITKEPAGKGVFCGDIRDVDFSKLLELGEIDVITGGPPCQDFSLIRGAEKRMGILVKRGRLYVHFIRALVTLQPKVFIFENVKGLMSANGGIAFAQILKDFKNLNLRWPDMWDNHRNAVNAIKETSKLEGYEIFFSSLVDFSKIGVPQQRERIIVIGVRRDLVDQENLFEIKSKTGAFLTGADDLIATFPLTPIETFMGRPLIELQNEYRELMLEFEEIRKSIRSDRSDQYFSTVWSRYNFEIWHDYLIANGLSPYIDNKIKEQVMERHEEILKELGYYGKPLEGLYFEDDSNQILEEEDHVKLRMSFIPPGENHEFVRGTDYEVTGLMSNIYRRIHPLKPSPTIIARGGGGTWGYHYKRSRQRLTNRERARLQTFPDFFLFEGRPQEVRRQIGEAVPPLASKRIAEAVAYILENVR